MSVNEYTARASARVKKSKLFRMSWKTFWFWHFWKWTNVVTVYNQPTDLNSTYRSKWSKRLLPAAYQLCVLVCLHGGSVCHTHAQQRVPLPAVCNRKILWKICMTNYFHTDTAKSAFACSLQQKNLIKNMYDRHYFQADTATMFESALSFHGTHDSCYLSLWFNQAHRHYSEKVSCFTL